MAIVTDTSERLSAHFHLMMMAGRVMVKIFIHPFSTLALSASYSKGSCVWNHKKLEKIYTNTHWPPATITSRLTGEQWARRIEFINLHSIAPLHAQIFILTTSFCLMWYGEYMSYNCILCSSPETCKSMSDDLTLTSCHHQQLSTLTIISM